MTETSDAGEDLVGRLGPDERLGVPVVGSGVGGDGGFKGIDIGKTPRRSWRAVRIENQHSTRLSQDAEVGVKCR